MQDWRWSCCYYFKIWLASIDRFDAKQSRLGAVLADSPFQQLDGHDQLDVWAALVVCFWSAGSAILRDRNSRSRCLTQAFFQRMTHSSIFRWIIEKKDFDDFFAISISLPSQTSQKRRKRRQKRISTLDIYSSTSKSSYPSREIVKTYIVAANPASLSKNRKNFSVSFFFR